MRIKLILPALTEATNPYWRPRPRYVSGAGRTLVGMPPIRRDLIKRARYLVSNSIVVTRGCPPHCDFCCKDSFFEGGKSFYPQTVDDALAEINLLPGRHLYFLDDHLPGNVRSAAGLFERMRGSGRLFQGAATADSILRGNGLLEKAARAQRLSSSTSEMLRCTLYNRLSELKDKFLCTILVLSRARQGSGC